MFWKALLIACPVLMVAVASREAQAQMPSYDVEKHCEKIASFGGSRSEMLYESCFDMEQSAYDATKPIWSSLPQAMKSHCNRVAAFGGSGSYSLLQSCIDMERSSASNNARREFRR